MPDTPIGIAMIGTGGIALANHLPGFGMCPQARVVALCDSSPIALHRAVEQTGIDAGFSDYRQVLARDDVDAVVVATPNYTHAEIVLAAVGAGKHVMCEKPLAMNLAQAMEMYRAAEAAGVRHMTAFTYRFVPAMHYMAHLVKSGKLGKIYHFRAQRFQDWGSRGLGWRQVKKLAATGELGDMLSHRIDFGHVLAGPIRRVVADLKQFVETRDGQPSDLDDWVGMLAQFERGATGVLESTKLATGRGEGGQSRDYCEINGTEGSAVYLLGRPTRIEIGKKGGAGLEEVDVPPEFLKWPGSPRDPRQGDPIQTFRYDQDWEFVQAILEQRPCRPSFKDGVMVQAVMEAAVRSAEQSTWVDVEKVD